MTDTHIKITGKHWAEAVRQLGGYSNLAICNKAIGIALAEQNTEQDVTLPTPKKGSITHFGCVYEEGGKLIFGGFHVNGTGAKEDAGTIVAKAFIARIEDSLKKAQQESEYITAEEARKLGAGNAEYFDENRKWSICGTHCAFYSGYRYRAIKAQPEPSDPHAALRAEYAKQVMSDTDKFYKWECKFDGYYDWSEVNVSAGFGSDKEYRYTDISCMVALKGEPVKRILRTAAQELQRSLGDTVEWSINETTFFSADCALSFDGIGTYTYAPKALKQPAWTGSREDVIALLKEVRLLKEGAV